jgi:hypothetical protein
MDLKSWREKRAGERFDLPSGLSVRLKKLDLLDLAAQGMIPTTLAGAANKLVGGTGLKVEEFESQVEVINLIVQACLVEPLAADEADENHIRVDELAVMDRLAIYNWASAGAARLRPFRDEEGQSAAAGPGGEAVRGETVGDAGDR